MTFRALFRALALAGAVTAGLTPPVLAQSSPGWVQNYKPTPTEWNSWFARKQDFGSAGSLPFPSSTTLGGVKSGTAPTHQFETGISTLGVPTFAQPAIADIVGLGTIASQSAGGIAVTGGSMSGVTVSGGDTSLANVTANGAAFARTLAAWHADRINAKGYGAKGDYQTQGGGAITSGSASLAVTGATFTAADVGKSFTLNGAGTNAGVLSGTISAFVDSTHVTLSANAASTVAASTKNAGGYTPIVAGGTTYVPGNTITLAGGTFTTATVLTVASTKATAITINAAGTGGTGNGGSANGNCSIFGTTGTGGKFVATVALSSGGLGSIIQLRSGGQYYTNPTSLTGEPVTSTCGALTGATVNITAMAVYSVTVTTPGIYSVAPSSPVAQGSTNGSGTGATFTVTYSTAGNFSYGTDDSAAVNLAIARSNTLMSAGGQACVFFPAGTYLFKGAAITAFAQNTAGCLLGEGSRRSYIHLDAAYAGDVFSWSDAWGAGTGNTAGTSESSFQKLGPTVIGLGIGGDQSAASQQNAFMLYDHNDNVYFRDVSVGYVHGYGVRMGAMKNGTVAYTRESRFEDLRIFNTGMTNVPALDITSQCSASCASQDATNEVSFVKTDIYAPYAQGVWIHNEMGSGPVVRSLWFHHLRVEGAQNNYVNSQADLVQIGDAAQAGGISTVYCSQCELIGPNTGFAALDITGQSAAGTANIRYEGVIGQAAGQGKGLVINAGSNILYRGAAITGPDWNLVVASSATTGTPIVIDLIGQGGLYENIDATANQYVFSPNGIFGAPGGAYTQGSQAFPFVSAQIPTGNTNGGNNRGTNSVDWQVFCRSAATQVASGSNATIGGGCNNTASNIDTTVAGGNTNLVTGFRATVGGGFGNTASGQYSVVHGGLQANDHGDFGWDGYASGDISTTGDAQAGTFVMRGTGNSTSAVQLTTNGGAAGATTCANIPSGTVWTFRLMLAARDVTTPASGYTYVLPAATLVNNAGTVTMVLGTPVTLSTNAWGPTVAVTADNTNKCISVTFAGTNTDVTHFDARIDTVEVQ